MLNITKSKFEKEVIFSEIPVVLDFWATWCGFLPFSMGLPRNTATGYAFVRSMWTMSRSFPPVSVLQAFQR